MSFKDLYSINSIDRNYNFLINLENINHKEYLKLLLNYCSFYSAFYDIYININNIKEKCDDIGIDERYYFNVIKMVCMIRSQIYKFNINNLKITESSGLSIVVIYNSYSIKKVFQYFKNNNLYHNIKNIYNIIDTNNLFQYNNLLYNPKNYYVKLIKQYDLDQVIEWEYLEHLYIGYDIMFIKNNIIKIIWDITLALKYFEYKNINHNDCRLDNIGFSNDKFILFDFDNCKINNNFSKDINDLLESLKLRTNVNYIEMIDIVRYIMKIKNLSYDDAIDYLTKLQIIY